MHLRGTASKPVILEIVLKTIIRHRERKTNFSLCYVCSRVRSIMNVSSSKHDFPLNILQFFHRWSQLLHDCSKKVDIFLFLTKRNSNRQNFILLFFIFTCDFSQSFVTLIACLFLFQRSLQEQERRHFRYKFAGRNAVSFWHRSERFVSIADQKGCYAPLRMAEVVEERKIFPLDGKSHLRCKGKLSSSVQKPHENATISLTEVLGALPRSRYRLF